MLDVALDPYTSHGHDGLMDGRATSSTTRPSRCWCEQALVQAEAGCDIIAPSDMMDGRVGAIRARARGQRLRARADHGLRRQVRVSGFYGPFRDAIGSAATLIGDKRTYQMDPANSDEAMREVALDIAEGADMVMVKPGMPYLDIVRRVKDDLRRADLRLPGVGRVRDDRWPPQQRLARSTTVMIEALLAFKRAGADGILTYFAVEVAKDLKG